MLPWMPLLAALALLGAAPAPAQAIVPEREAPATPRASTTSVAAASERGAVFFSGKSRLEFLACLRRQRVPQERRIEIAWQKDDRPLRCVLSRTPAEIAAMGDVAYDAWRRAWSPWREAERRRLHPLHDEVQGYGSPESRERLLQGARDLELARGREDFLRRCEERVERGWLSLLWLPRGGQPPSAYGVPIGEVSALSDDAFLVWRRRFLRWIDVHTPGQSRVTAMAAMTEAEFEVAYAQSKDSFSRDVDAALLRFWQRAGIALAPPCYGERRAQPRVTELAVQLQGREGGLCIGDTILVVESRPVTEWDECIAAIDAYGRGSVLKLVVTAAGGGTTTRLLPLS